MHEIYGRFKDELIDVRLSRCIRTFNEEDLSDYLSLMWLEEKVVVRKFIKKKIARNEVIINVVQKFTAITDANSEINEQKEISELVRDMDLSELVANQKELIEKYKDINSLASSIKTCTLSRYIESKGHTSLGQIGIQLDNISELYKEGITISLVHEYLENLCIHLALIMHYYNSDINVAYVEEYEQDVVYIKNKVDEYDIKSDLRRIVKQDLEVKSYVESKYAISDEIIDKFSELIELANEIQKNFKSIQRIIEETEFVVEHSRLLKGYVKGNLSTSGKMLSKSEQLFKKRTICSRQLKDNLVELKYNIKETTEQFLAINEIELNYLPKISAQDYTLLEDVKSYYNYSIKKNIERRIGAYGFSKEIKEEEIKCIIELIEEKLYKLTDDQLKAIYKGADFLNYPYTTNCLLQGDVSSGKTIVSVALMFILAQKGYKSAYIVPRKSLRIQHFNTLNKYNELFGLDLNIVDAQTVSSIKEADIILNGYSFSKEVFNDICIDMAFVDEIQLLGVKQRNSIQNRYENIDMFYTTATPHPRTKTISLIGNMDVIEIRQLPPGRKPKITKSFDYSYNFVAENRQLINEIFEKDEMMIVVCPHVNTSEGDIDNVHNAYEYFKGEFPAVNITKLLSNESEIQSEIYPGITVMDEKLNECSTGKTDILVTSKIIEVGVDIPRASIMVIAHQINGFGFGVSSLHQLRGRVGRRQQQAYCFIQAPNGYKSGSAIDTVIKTEDVFEITENDLDWRGIDKIIGLNQTSKSGNKKNAAKLIAEYKYIADNVKTAVVNLNDKMFDALCQEVDTSQKLKDLN